MRLHLRATVLFCQTIFLSAFLSGPLAAASPADWSKVPTETVKLFYPGQGGYQWETVYNMPIWLRKFTFREIPSGNPAAITFLIIFLKKGIVFEKSASGLKLFTENPIEGIE